MSPFLVALFGAAGVSAWVYNKAMRYTGNNTKQSLTIAGATAVIIFILFLTVISFINSAIEG
ncbi:MAG TPA: hypothetical protein VFK11_00220 [Candidatus Saccharimonadales bacterium]|nr:hypothetical protein [Candidatus Saccharimonadales bacterium]